jgi:hypothetical protein
MSVSMKASSLSVVKTEQSGHTWKVFFGVLFASLRHVSTPYMFSQVPGGRVRTLAGLLTFCPIDFHLLFSYSLMAFNNAWL